MREVLGAAWPLFQVCLPRCLPLAIIAIVVGSIPVGNLPGHEWWGVVLARSLVVLICYGAMLRLQQGLDAGERPQLRNCLSDAVRDLPAVVVIVVAWLLPFVPAMAATAWRGFDWLAMLLTVAASALVVHVLPAWPALIATRAGPWAALVASTKLVRGRWVEISAVVLTMLAGILVFLLLASIFIGMIMNLAGQGANPSASALAASRWLISISLAAPVVYAGALAVVIWRVASTAGHTATPADSN